GDVRVADGTPDPGQACRVRVPKELRRMTPGFYVATGDAEAEDDSVTRSEYLDRYYWHLTRDAAVPFMAAVVPLLNADQVRFRVKVLADPARYLRADAGVLYTRKRDRAQIAAIITVVHGELATRLRVPVPLFTRRLADGLGFAEDPGSVLSFGEHRCRLVAAAIVHSFTRNENSLEARAATLASLFTHAGLDPQRPHLGPGSDDDAL